MNQERFSEIGHRGMAFWNPISADVLDPWIAGLPLSSTSQVLDVGCGRAELLLRIVELHGCRAIGVDRSDRCIRAAREEAGRRLLSPRVDLRCEPFDAETLPVRSMDLAACVGSTHAISNLEQTLRVLSLLVRPGGTILVGEGYWKQEPAPEYLAFLDSSPDDLRTHAGNLALAEEHGLQVLAIHETTAAEWKRYEDAYAGNIRRFVESNPEDRDATAMHERIRAWHAAYLRWGRDTLGFALYLLRTPG